MRPVRVGGVTLAVEDSESGRVAGEQPGAGEPRVAGKPTVVLAHGLTATRRHVLHGSRLLERSGYRTVAYDARGHGESTPAPDPAEYEYSDLVADLSGLLDSLGIERAVLAGSSMGAHTTLAFALQSPERVSALVQITPAYAGRSEEREAAARWDELADALERGGVDGFLAAYGDPPIESRFRSLFLRAVRQRMERHRHPEAVAAALRVVPRSHPFADLGDLERVEPPTLVVGSSDEADPEHPYEVACLYAERIPRAELVSEEPGASPIAWRGAQLSREIAAFLERRGVAGD